MPRPVIAIDGPAAAGKGTLARALADALGFAHLDTGLLYRAVGALLIAAGHDLDDSNAAGRVAARLAAADLTRDDLRSGGAGEAASRVAAMPAVRLALVDFQRRFAESPPGGARGAVLDGRDIGTHICPDAPLKLFVTASAEQRARRRHAELRAAGENRILSEVLEDVRRRDHRDFTREDAPLRPADDAVIVDTTSLDEASMVRHALALAADRLGLDGQA